MDFEYPDEPPQEGYHIVRKWVDGTGVNVRWMDKNGEVHESNFPQELDVDDQWKDRVDDKVAKLYAQEELAKEETQSQDQDSEMSMEVSKVSDANWQNKEVKLEDKVEKKKKQMKKRKEKQTKRRKEMKQGKRQEKRQDATPEGAKEA